MIFIKIVRAIFKKASTYKCTGIVHLIVLGYLLMNYYYLPIVCYFQKVSELKAEMRKIKLDPRRHNLPEIIDYATVQKENRIIMTIVDKWRKKVEVLQVWSL